MCNAMNHNTVFRTARSSRSPRLCAFALAHLALLLPLGVSADTYGDYTYTVSDGGATITKYNGSGGAVAIPSTFGSHPVTAIGNYAFSEHTLITSVTIPDSVTNICDWAFLLCSSLATVTIGNSVTNIGGYAFAECPSLTAMTIPNSVSDIGTHAFAECPSLTAVTIGNSVTNIGGYAFADCPSLTNILFTGDAPALGYSAFHNNNPATFYYLPGIGDWPSWFGGRPTVCWNPAFSSASPASGAFAVTLTGNPSAALPVRIEASDSLSSPSWLPLSGTTTIPAGGTLNFTDPDASPPPARFYRITFPR